MSAAYYSDESVELWHGDCREVTAWLEADVLVTDPPYGISWPSGSMHAAGRQMRVANSVSGDENLDARDVALAAWGAEPAIVFGSWRQTRPAHDDAGLLRTVVQLLRVGAIAARSRRDSEGLETAEERITEARAMLSKVDVIRAASGSIRKSAIKIEFECDAAQTSIDRLLSQALNALAGVAIEVTDAQVSEPAPAPSAGVA